MFDVSEMYSWTQNQSILLLTMLSINCIIIVFQYQTYFFIVVISGVSRWSLHHGCRTFDFWDAVDSIRVFCSLHCRILA